MIVHLHVGLDKTGSSAIQFHTFHNRDWIHSRGMFVPQTGLTATGHNELFKTLFPQGFSALTDELEDAQKAGFDAAFITSETIHFLSIDQLVSLKSQLDGHQIQIYVYLREQAEIIQTGYAQQMKTRRQVTTLEDFKASKALLTPAVRDYDTLLEKLSTVFGKSAIDIGIFERERLRDGNIVNDMLEKLGLKPDHEFAQFDHQQNISLDLPSLVILNEMDLRNETDVAARHAAVDILMNDISLHGAGEKYFLSAEDVALIRASFAASNTRVVENYLDRNWPHAALFSYHGSPWNTSAPADIAQAVSRKNSVLARHTDYPTWNGKTVSGVDLQRFVVAADEWLPATAAGLCTQSAACTLRFRLEWRHITPAHSPIALNIAGRTGAQAHR